MVVTAARVEKLKAEVFGADRSTSKRPPFCKMWLLAAQVARAESGKRLVKETVLPAAVQTAAACTQLLQ
jgi:hypothetical protein